MAGDGDEADLERLQGLRLLQRLRPLLERLRDEACQRDRAGNRELFYDQLCSLVLLTFFNPALKSLRDLQQASRLKQVRKKLGCSQAALGSLSERCGCSTRNACWRSFSSCWEASRNRPPPTSG